VTLQTILLFIAAYLIGAIPFSVLFGKIFYNKDIRKFGSGNAGATNTFRVLGATAGIIVLILDIGKGMLAVLLANWITGIDAASFTYYQIALGFTAAIGHIFPVYLAFKGGKGVATLFGAVLVIFPWAALFCMITFAVVFFSTRFVSLGSISASLVFMIAILFFDERKNQWPILFFAIAAPAIIIYTHRKNIQRLLKGTENRISFTKKSEAK